MYLNVKVNNVPVKLEVQDVGPATFEDIDVVREKLKSEKLVLVEKSILQKVREGESVESIEKVVPIVQEGNMEDTRLESAPVESGLEPVQDTNAVSGESNEEPISKPELERISEPTTSSEQIHDAEREHDPSRETPEYDCPATSERDGGNGLPAQDESENDKRSALDVLKEVKDIFEKNKDSQVSQGKKPWYKSKTMLSNIAAALVCVSGMFVSDNPEHTMYLPASILAFINIYLRSVTKTPVKMPMED